MPLDRFTNYRLIPQDYVPDNIHQPTIQPNKPKAPLVAYNKKGEPIGFTWNYGDTIYLEFNTEGTVTYEPGDPGYKDLDSYIAEDANLYLTSPTSPTHPHSLDNDILLRGDNAKDPCVDVQCISTESVDEEKDSNTQDATNYFEDGTKIFQVLIYNFRYEVVAWCEAPAAPKVVILSDSFYPHSLVRGTYKLKLNLIDKAGGSRITLIPSQKEDGSMEQDCTIFIK